MTASWGQSARRTSACGVSLRRKERGRPQSAEFIRGTFPATLFPSMVREYFRTTHLSKYYHRVHKVTWAISFIPPSLSAANISVLHLPRGSTSLTLSHPLRQQQGRFGKQGSAIIIIIATNQKLITVRRLKLLCLHWLWWWLQWPVLLLATEVAIEVKWC